MSNNNTTSSNATTSTSTSLHTVIICPVGEKAYVSKIDTSLESLQSIVDGLIEFYYLDDNHFLVCNDEGKLLGLPLNRCIIDENTMDTIEVIAGNFIIARDAEADYNLDYDEYDEDSDGFSDLTPADINYFMDYYEYPEDIIMLNNKQVIGIPYNPDEYRDFKEII